MYTASLGLEGHSEHQRGGSPGDPKLGGLDPHSHRLFLTSTASSGLEGHFAHHLAAELGSPGRAKHGRTEPHVQRLDCTERFRCNACASAGLEGHSAHHLPASPGRPKDGTSEPQWHSLAAALTAPLGWEGRKELGLGRFRGRLEGGAQPSEREAAATAGWDEEARLKGRMELGLGRFRGRLGGGALPPEREAAATQALGAGRDMEARSEGRREAGRGASGRVVLGAVLEELDGGFTAEEGGASGSVVLGLFLTLLLLR
mmetsp:Transcript_30996/g.87798  ORF Transcript_30996/g.87798 Transcript_30996/m.87798 type:complete len:259 (-) Transcript_30996:35-811(-)